MLSTESPLYEINDIVKIKDGVPWNWKSLKDSLPQQITDEHVLYAKPISKIAEIEKIYTKKQGKIKVRVYLLRFTSNHSLEVSDEFMAQNVYKIDERSFNDTSDDNKKAEGLLEVFEDNK